LRAVHPFAAWNYAFLARINDDRMNATLARHTTAYAIFSRDAPHNMRDIVTCGWSVDEETWEQMREVVEAEDPLGVLMGEPRDPLVDVAMVSARRFYFSSPVDLPNIASVEEQVPDFMTTEPLIVQTIKKTCDGWSVLLPGYGEAWVRSGDVVAVKEVISPTTRPLLDLTCEGTDSNTAVVFCSLAGPSTRSM
jgi:hypothetical protein